MKKYWSEIKALILLGTIFIFVFMVDITIVYLYYRHVDNFIRSQPMNVNADVGILFFGDYTEDVLDIGPNSKTRANKAITLYNAKKINNIICVGGYYFKTWQGRPHHMRNYLIKNGIPPDAITNDSLSFNTITNWDEAKKIMHNSNFKSAIIISEPFHVFRISLMIEDTNIYYSSYKYRLVKFKDYWVSFKDVHHEFLSHILSFILHDKLRNKIVYTYRNVMFTVKKIF